MYKWYMIITLKNGVEKVCSMMSDAAGSEDAAKEILDNKPINSLMGLREEVTGGNIFLFLSEVAAINFIPADKWKEEYYV